MALKEIKLYDEIIWYLNFTFYNVVINFLQKTVLPEILRLQFPIQLWKQTLKKSGKPEK